MTIPPLEKSKVGRRWESKLALPPKNGGKRAGGNTPHTPTYQGREGGKTPHTPTEEPETLNKPDVKKYKQDEEKDYEYITYRNYQGSWNS